MDEGSKSGIFAFDQFTLDGDNLMLYRAGVEVSLPPKVAKTLAVLVERAGSIISKDEVIARVWDDSIVEESNLTQYLYLLRKVLGTMPDGRPYIETLRRRGYRFNGEVERIEVEKPVHKPAHHEPPREPLSQLGVERDGNVLRVVDWQPSAASENEPLLVSTSAESGPAANSIMPRLALALGALLFIGGAAFFFWPKLMPAASSVEEPPRERAVIRLTNGPIPRGATISEDGNVFAYSENEGDVARLYVQQTGQTSRVEIENSTDEFFIAKTFSSDGQALYFVGLDRLTKLTTLYRIPVMGGPAVKIIEDVFGAVSVSRDGKEIVFTRMNKKTNDSALVIARSDGRADRILLHRKSPAAVISPSPSWSPDGKSIAFGEFQLTDRGPGNYRIQLADVATGRTTPFSAERWDNLLRLMWVPDGSGVGVIGTRENESHSVRRDQVYFVSYPAGVSHRVSLEGSRHEPDSLGITKKGDILTVPFNRSSQLWVLNSDGDAASATQLTRGAADGRAGLVTLPDGRFAYLARTAEEVNVIISNADATSTKQIATGFEFVEELRADPLGRFLVFSTIKDGKSHMFRVDLEGGSVKQLSFGGTIDTDSSVSPDGKLLVYDAAIVENGISDYRLMQVPTEGGEATTLRSKGCFLPTHSPDGSLLSCISSSDSPDLVILSAKDASELERYKLPIYSVWNFGVGWTTDGSGLVYIVSNEGVSNLWVQPRGSSAPRKLTNFTSGEIYRYAFSRDGSKIYVARGYPSQDVFLTKNYR